MLRAALSPGRDTGRAGWLRGPAGAVRAAGGTDGAGGVEDGGAAHAAAPGSSVVVHQTRLWSPPHCSSRWC